MSKARSWSRQISKVERGGFDPRTGASNLPSGRGLIKRLGIAAQIVGHGDVGPDDQADRTASTAIPTLDQIITLHPSDSNASVMNKTG